MFQFDQEQHRYTLGDRRLRSVTEILDDNRLINKSGYNETVRSRGSAVHAAIALELRGKSYDIDPDLIGYVKSALRFLGQPGLTVLDFEVPAYHPLYLYAGTRDIRYTLQGFEWIGDWKTGGPAKWHRYQTGAYDLLAPQIKKMRRRCGIYLEADGSMPKSTEHPDASDAQYFLAFNASTQGRVIYGQTKEEEYENVID